MSTAPDVSIVMVTYNSAAELPGLQTALPSALADLTAELVVVDNGSADGSADLAGVLWPAATLIRRGGNTGFAAAVNAGLRAARAPFVLLLNPDARPEPAALARLVAHLRATPTAGLAAPLLTDARGRATLSCYPFPSLGTVIWRYFHLDRLLPGALGGRYRHVTLGSAIADHVTVPWAQGACLLLRRAVLEAIGNLDERFVFYGEEVDLQRRASAAGWPTHFVPAARVAHAEGTSARRVVPFKLASHYFSVLAYFDKHHTRVTGLALRLLLLLDLATRLPVRLIGLPLGRPADAAARLAAYRLAIWAVLTPSGTRRLERWRALAATGGRR